jgi:hypothetical protein
MRSAEKMPSNQIIFHRLENSRVNGDSAGWQPTAHDWNPLTMTVSSAATRSDRQRFATVRTDAHMIADGPRGSVSQKIRDAFFEIAEKTAI